MRRGRKYGTDGKNAEDKKRVENSDLYASGEENI
jgi:hypothetical protein